MHTDPSFAKQKHCLEGTRVLEVYMTGQVRGFLGGLKISTFGKFFGSRDLSHIFVGLKVCLIEYISIKVLKSCIFGGLKNFDARYFLGVKFQAHVFLVLAIEALLDPPPSIMYTARPPWLSSTNKITLLFTGSSSQRQERSSLTLQVLMALHLNQPGLFHHHSNTNFS